MLSLRDNFSRASIGAIAIEHSGKVTVGNGYLFDGLLQNAFNAVVDEAGFSPTLLLWRQPNTAQNSLGCAAVMQTPMSCDFELAQAYCYLQRAMA